MKPTEKGRGMLLSIRKDIGYIEVENDFGFKELQVNHLLLTKRDIVIASTYHSPSSTSEIKSNVG